MKYLVSGFLDVLNEILMDLMGLFTGAFWEGLGISVKKGEGLTWSQSLLAVGGKFDEWLPGVVHLKESFVLIGSFFVVLLFFAGIMKAFLPDGISETAEHPFAVVGRAVGAAFCVIWAFQIMYFLQAPMAGIFDGIYQLSQSEKTLAAGFESEAWGGAGHLNFRRLSDGDNKIVESLGGTALLIIMSFAVMWMYIKLVLEMVERYVTTCFLFYVSPLAFSALASRSTQAVAGSFIRMLFAQYLLIMFNCIFLFVFCYAYSQMGSHEFASISEAIIYFAAMMAWLKLGQRLDEHMNTLGLGAARTGAGLGGELMAAAGLAYGGMKLAGKTIRQGAGFGRGLATGKAAGPSPAAKLGNLTHKGAKKIASKPSVNRVLNSAADGFGIGEGLKGAAVGGGKLSASGSAGSLYGKKSILEAAMSARTTGGQAARAAANQGLTLSGGASPGFESARIGNGHITGVSGGRSYDFVPKEGKAVSGPAISATGPDGKEWICSLRDSYGNADLTKLDSDFARTALGADSMNSYLNGKWGGAGFGRGDAAGIYTGYAKSGQPVTLADASVFQKDGHFTKAETHNGRQMLMAEGHYQPSFKK